MAEHTGELILVEIPVLGTILFELCSKILQDVGTNMLIWKVYIIFSTTKVTSNLEKTEMGNV